MWFNVDARQERERDRKKAIKYNFNRRYKKNVSENNNCQMVLFVNSLLGDAQAAVVSGISERMEENTHTE